MRRVPRVGWPIGSGNFGTYGPLLPTGPRRSLELATAPGGLLARSYVLAWRCPVDRTVRPRQPTLAQLQAQARAAERAQQVADIAALEKALTTLHHTPFRDSARYILPTPAAPTSAGVEAVRHELYRAATAGVPIWRRADRKAAKTWAAAQSAVEAQRRHTGQIVTTQLEQHQLDEHWNALCRHDPLTVIDAVDEAFADNASDSTCVDAGTDPDTGASYVTAVVSFASVELVPEHRADVTPGGKPTLRKRSKTDRNALYATALASTVLATAKEALAVAVAASEVRVLVVRKAAAGIEPVYAGTFSREGMARVDWHSVDPLVLAMAANDAQLTRKGSTREVVALSVEPGSPAHDLLDALTRA